MTVAAASSRLAVPARDGARRASTRSCSAARPTPAPCRAPTGSGSRAPVRSRPAASSCAARASVHLLANSNDGFEDFPPEHLYPLTWNPETLLDALRAIPGLTDARTRRRRRHVARDPRAVRRLSPRRASSSTPDRSSPSCGACTRPRRSRPCTKPRASRATGWPRWPRCSATACGHACCAACARSGSPSLGVTTPAFEAVAAPIDGGASTWLPPERLLGAGEHVALRAGALRNGWEASLARTYVVGEPSRSSSRRPTVGATRSRSCRPGHARRPAPRPRRGRVRRRARRRALRRRPRARGRAWCSRSSCTRASRLHQDVLHLTDTGDPRSSPPTTSSASS